MMRIPILAAILTALAAVTETALAHGGVPPDPELWRTWTADPYVLVPLFVAHWIYGRGVFRLWRRAGRAPAALSHSHVALFLGGEIVLLLALVSPMETLSGLLLSAHMAQHLLLMTLAPLLLLAGRPEIAFAWGLPRRWTEAMALSDGWRVPRRAFQVFARPFPAALLHGAALWIWHAPAAFDAALRSPELHALEHGLFLGTALLFWRSIIRSVRLPTTTAAAIVATLITIIHSGFLAALLTFAPRPLYETYAAVGVTPFGMSPVEDQQLAGLLMWVPAGVIYLLAVVLLGWRLLGEDEDAGRPVPASQAASSSSRHTK